MYSCPITVLDKPLGFQQTEAARISKQSAYELVSLSALRTERCYPPTPGDVSGNHFC